jgi:phage terminase large subunit-like protein
MWRRRWCYSPVLAKRLKITDYKKRIFDVKTNSFYQVIAADAQSALGSNPSGVGADEILAWRGREMWIRCVPAWVRVPAGSR